MISLVLRLLLVSFLSCLTEAHSTTRNPLSRLWTLQNATIHTPKHRVTALSHFELTFTIAAITDDDGNSDSQHSGFQAQQTPQQRQTVRLRLEPNPDILASDAHVVYLAPDGTISHREDVDRLAHRVFKGSAWIRENEFSASPILEDQAVLYKENGNWRNVGWSRILVRQDGNAPFFEGAFALDRNHHHIMSLRNYRRTKHPLDPEIDGEENERSMVMWRDSDILPVSAIKERRGMKEAEPRCHANTLDFNSRPDHPVFGGVQQQDENARFSAMSKRQIDGTSSGNSAGVDLRSTIGQTAGCPTTRKVALVGVATDCTYASDFSSTEELRENVISQMNQASAVWEDAFNISLGLQNMTVSDASCPSSPPTATLWNQACSQNINIGDRLNYFSAWRGQQGGDNSHWTLLTTCNTGSTVGLAWLGQACVGGSYSSNVSFTGNGQSGGDNTETVSGANVVVRTQGTNEWQIIAHETGHTFGAVHDCDSSTCENSQVVDSQQCCPLSSSTCSADAEYIMNPFASSGVSLFSPCTIGNICSALGRNSVKSTCLSDNKGVVTISGGQCGNGIVEPGEQCDCGGAEGCADDPCCDGTTCQFVAGAVCDDANEECCSGCQLARNGTVCRASTGSCDPEEVCSGSSATCPVDVTAPNGQDCGDGLSCASGMCTSRDMQCQNLMGAYTRDNSTTACDSLSCTISCSAPSLGYGQCYALQQNFLDGTSCSGGGRCENGQCRGLSARSWINQNKPLVIGLSVAGGLVLLIGALCCISSCCRKSRRPPPPPPPPARRYAVPPPPANWQGWNGPQPRMQQPPAQGWYGGGVARQPDMRPPPPPYQPEMRGTGAGWRPPVPPQRPIPPPPPVHRSSSGLRYA